MKIWFLSARRPLTGLLLCGVAALGAAIGLSQHPLRFFLPIVFAIVIVLLATRYGLLVGIVGPVMAVLAFAYFVYPPIGSFRVADASARSSLAWMTVASVALSFLLAPSGPHQPHSK